MFTWHYALVGEEISEHRVWRTKKQPWNIAPIAKGEYTFAVEVSHFYGFQFSSSFMIYNFKSFQGKL